MKIILGILEQVLGQISSNWLKDILGLLIQILEDHKNKKSISNMAKFVLYNNYTYAM